MFNEAARKFYDRFQLGKVYYISRGTLRVANKQFKTVRNDYEMNLNENSEVEEASNEETFIPETKFNFVQIDELGRYVNGSDLVGKNHRSLFITFYVLLYVKRIDVVVYSRCYRSSSKCFSNNEHPKEK